MSNDWVQKWDVESSSSNAVYVVGRRADGTFGCSCPAWKFKKVPEGSTRPDCKHITEIKRTKGFSQIEPAQIRAVPKCRTCFLSLTPAERDGIGLCTSCREDRAWRERQAARKSCSVCNIPFDQQADETTCRRCSTALGQAIERLRDELTNNLSKQATTPQPAAVAGKRRIRRNELPD